ncbi:uncharacterized protein G2W53_026087 [Senna tora]|uniref:ATP-dependent DNA helicase n=1 Tax=Senna tora TaxID=362788 RepID=A0A834TED4_9FABA|nr:uncharacterized protein G2W53_026087 [Senna tora]
MNSMSPAMVPKEIHLSSATPHVHPKIVHNGSPHSNKLSQEYVDIGLPTYECEHCGAIFWYEESINKSRNTKNPKFSLCCLQGKVQLPKRRDPPKILENLLVNNDSRRDLLSGADETPRFSQLYIYDIDNEVFDRMRNASSSATEDPSDASVVMQLSQMLDSINPLVKVFRSVKDHPSLSSRDSLRLKLIKKRTTGARIYNLPTADEVVALIVGDFDPENVEKDIIVEERSETLKRIDELHPLYLPMQYPLMFPRGEDGYRQDVLFRGETTSSNIGKRIALASSFTGSERYSRENFQDAMTISQDRPNLLSRVFMIKLNALMKDITKEFLFGTCRADIYTIEFQKRGLPHAHIQIWLNAEHKLTNEALIDSVICAKIPDQNSNPRLYEAVKTFMIHGPCGLDRKTSPCMVKSRCSKHFSKKFTHRNSFDEDGYCKYHRRDSGHFIEKNGIKLDNSKGHDKVIAALCNPKSDVSSEENSNEIKTYLDCRYISPCEAVWRIFGFDINFHEPSIERIPFHLLDQQGVVFPDNAPIDSVVLNATVKQTKFLAWFEANKKYPKARFLTYSQFLTQFVYKTDCRQWFKRKSGRSIGRLYYVAPSSGELYYLRLLLTFTKGPTCYEDIRIINGVVYPTLKDACYVMGLLDEDKEYIEGSKWSSGIYLRKLFATLLIRNTIFRPAHVWENTWMYLSYDILLKERHRTCTANPDLHLDDDRVQKIALAKIENLLKINGRSLSDFLLMPMPNEALMRNIGNLLISEELNYDRNALKSEHAHLLSSLTTYIWNTLTSAVRSKGEIVLAVASSGISSQLIPRGRTAHSRFAIPLNIDGNSTCHIVKGMVVLGGDFRQILPVIPRAVREDIVLASLNSSYLWPSCKVLSLTKNMRLYQGYSVEENSTISRFAEWILKVGEGNIGNIINDEEHEITIDDDIPINDAEEPIQAIVESTYLKLVDNFKNHVYFRERAILSPTLDDVAQVNEFMLGLLPGEERTYLSSDTICNQDPQDELAEVYTTEFFNTICGFGLPYHQLKLKVGAPIMLLRNIDRSMGLCNGMRLILIRMCEHVIEASIMSGKFAGEKVLIARQTLSNVGIYLPRLVFSHDQLYVVVSRVRKRSGLKILVTDVNRRQMRTTTNVVFKEIFQNVK